MKLYQVTASRLNFRSSPAVLTNNVIRVLEKGQVLKVLDSTHPKWWKVKASVTDTPETGYVSREWIDDIDDLKALKAATGIEAVHLPANPAALRTAKWKWHFPLSENDMPVRDFSSLEQNIRSQYAIVEYLDVDNPNHARYRKTAIGNRTATFCNIYAHDFCKLNQVYLPRVWWKEDGIIPRLLRNQEVVAEYDKTVTELNANALYNWLVAWGEYFGWVHTASWQEAQNIVNTRGAIGLICSRRTPPTLSGHIACILPETDALPVPGRGTGKPLLSQAGASNFKFRYEKWAWDNPARYSAVGFWYNLNGVGT